MPLVLRPWDWLVPVTRPSTLWRIASWRRYGWGADHIYQALRTIGDYLPRSVVRRTVKQIDQVTSRAEWWARRRVITPEQARRGLPELPRPHEAPYEARYQVTVRHRVTGEERTWTVPEQRHRITDRDTMEEGFRRRFQARLNRTDPRWEVLEVRRSQLFRSLRPWEVE